MRKKLITILIVLTFISVASFSMAFYVTGDNSSFENTPTLDSRYEVEGIDGTPHFEGLTFEDMTIDKGNTWTVSVLDDSEAHYGMYYQDFEKIFSGLNCNIWIGLGPEDDWVDVDENGVYSENDIWYFSYPWTDIGIEDSGYPNGYYLNPGYRDWIYGWQLKYIIDQFDNNIHDKVVEHFGEYNTSRPGPLNDGKIQILIFNIKDDFYYDPVTATSFIEGYFWSYVSELNDANIFHMDTYQWWRRMGEVSMMDYPDEYNDFYWWPPHENEYEGTFAHEFQHLVHHDVDPDELAWVNEGCSTLAEWLCGYGFSPGHISEYLIWHWDTSLVIWEGYLSNYGAVFLWTFYMYEHYGGASLIKDLAAEQENGIVGWNNVLAAHGVEKTFDQIFQDWAIANYLDDTSIYGGIYGYKALDIPSADSEWWNIPYVMDMWESGYPDSFDWIVEKYPNYGYNYAYGSSLPYVVNYVQFYKQGSLRPLNIYFDGEDYKGVESYSGIYEWYSDGTGDSWFRLGDTFIPDSGAELTFWTYFDIEFEYDYGYVEVYDHYDNQWYTLPGIMTTSDLPEGYDNPNCPDEFEPTTYNATGRWNAFTGSSNGWYQEVMDLSDFAGHSIDLYFTYWTDPYTLGLGWYIDDIEITGFISDDVESGPGTWTVNDGWYITDGIAYNDYEVNFIEITNFHNKKDEIFASIYSIKSMELDPNSEDGYAGLWLLDINHVQHYNVMVIANQPGIENSFRSFYYHYAWVDNWWHIH